MRRHGPNWHGVSTQSPWGHSFHHRALWQVLSTCGHCGWGDRLDARKAKYRGQPGRGNQWYSSQGLMLLYLLEETEKPCLQDAVLPPRTVSFLSNAGKGEVSHDLPDASSPPGSLPEGDGHRIAWRERCHPEDLCNESGNAQLPFYSPTRESPRHSIRSGPRRPS